MKYTIYEIPGKKVGCTAHLPARIRDYPKGTKIKVLETGEGSAKKAGDREWYWADKKGYPRGRHYSKGNWNLTLSKETRSKNGKEVMRKKTRKQIKEMGRKGGKRGGGIWGKTLSKVISKCPHCKKKGSGVVMLRWHLSNCKQRNLTNDYVEIPCLYIT